MNQRSFEPILKKLKLDQLDQVYFNQAWYEPIQYQKQSQLVFLHVHLMQTIPYGVYERLKKQLSLAISGQVSLKLSAQEQNLDPKDVQHYLNAIYQQGTYAFFSNKSLSLIEENTLYFLLDQEPKDQLFKLELKQLKDDLLMFGIELSLSYRVKVIEDVMIEIKDQPLLETEASFNQTQVKMRKLKLEDYQEISLNQVVAGLKQVKVRGQIFSIEDQWVRSNTVLRKTVSFQDGTDALAFVKFLEQADELAKFNQLKEGNFIEVYGDIVFDNYGKDILINPRDIRQISNWNARKDDVDLKRVEFHLHTNMSDMDGISPIEAYIKQAFDWGHEGIAITDHNSVQAYPKAQKMVESLLKQYPERSFKMVYGCEFYFTEAKLDIVVNPTDQKLSSATYVVFDLETTGLSSKYDRIIEFGAVKVVEGMVVDRLQMFVNPEQALSSFIIEKTNITQKQVDTAFKEEACINQWLDFIGDSVLVAHNASFDTGFLTQACIRHGLKPLDNPVIDTLDFARALFKDRRSYRLGALAKLLKVPYDDSVAHRADYDAEVLVQVFSKMIDQVDGVQIQTLKDLDLLNTADAFKRQMKKHINILAKNAQGLKAIFKLVSIAHTDHLVSSGKDEGSSEPRLIRDDITLHREHLLIGSSCYNGEIFDLAATRSQVELEAAMTFYDYIEVQPKENYRPLIENNSVKDDARLENILKNIIDTALKLKIPVIASGDAHYLQPEDKIFRDVYIQSKGVGAGRHPLYIYDEKRRQMTKSPDQHLRSTQEMLEAFSFLDEQLAHHLVVHNPKRLLNLIEQVKPIKKELYTPSIEGADDKLKETVYLNARAKYGTPLPDLVEKRIQKELNSITNHGFGVIYYIAHLLVEKSLKDGYMVGSRGSVGSSVVATLANITEVNPLPPHYVCPKCQHSEFITDGSVDCGFDLEEKPCPLCHTPMLVDGHDIPFETFLGFEGDKVPDIDLNFSGDYQEKAHAYTKVLFGDEHVFRAGTISTVAQRTAYGYIKGYLEEMGLENTLRPAYMNYLAKGCEGVKRTSGQHPGGIIVIPQDNDVYDFTPVQFPANKANSEWLTTHFEFADIHDNVLKLDILGHVDPTAMKMLERLSGKDVRTIRMNDESAISVFSSLKDLDIQNPAYNEKTGAVGLPEFGTGFVRQILDSTKPRNFSDLVRVSGLSHGTDVWLNNAKDLISQGYPFSDVIGCRDDIMIYLIHKGLPAKSAFDIMESVRKGKGLKDEWKKLMSEFEVPDWYIQSCLRIKYMFPKAHAVAYVLMAVRVAWFKVHMPAVYYATYFTLRTTVNEYETVRLGQVKIHERLRNIQTRLSDQKLKSTVSNKEEELINALEVAYEMASRGLGFSDLDLMQSLASEYRIHPDHPNLLIPPFTILDGLGENVANSIVEARIAGPFLSKEDLQSRTLINNTQLKKFEQLGLLGHLDDQNQMSLF